MVRSATTCSTRSRLVTCATAQVRVFFVFVIDFVAPLPVPNVQVLTHRSHSHFCFARR